MLFPKVLRSTSLRSASITAALLCVVTSGCADQPTAPGLEPAGTGITRAAGTENFSYDRFFTAWSQGYSSGPIKTQVFALDTRMDRQFSPFFIDEAVLSFARANPGRLYINGDEPDQWCFPPYEYAGIYNDFVTKLRTADPTARVSPAGFSEPNARCCPEPAQEPCLSSVHGISYAEQFYNAYIQRFGVAPPVDEWRFHDFGLGLADGDMTGWWVRVDRLAAWSVAHGANMVLGAWGFHGWREPVSHFQEHMKQAIGRLASDPRIKRAVYWALEPWVETPRPLVNEIGGLTQEGQTYVNPLTDVPYGVKLVGSADGQAKVRWNNTTSAWGAEVEYWIQAPGSNSFVYGRTEHVPALGTTESPFAAFNIGDLVKARVRYYNAFGQAQWTPFSNTVLLALHESAGAQRTGLGKRPLFCILQLC